MKLNEFLIARAKMEAIAERQMVIRMRRAFRKTLEPLYESARLGLLTSTEQAKTLLKPTFIEEELKWLYVTWGYRMLLFFRSNFEPERKDDFWLRRLAELFTTKGAKKVTEIFNTTLNLAIPAIQEAISLANTGSSIDVIQKAIKKNVESSGGLMSMGRARTIARTEVISASNIASFEAMRGENQKVEKRWITGGANIRDSHINAEQEGWIPMDEKFLSTNMMHPGDPDGEAAEVINCKCTLVYRYVD